MTFTIAEKYAFLNREAELCKRFYAEHECALMEAIAEDYRKLAAVEAVVALFAEVEKVEETAR